MTNREWLERMSNDLFALFLRAPFRLFGHDVWEKCRGCEFVTTCCGDHPCADAISAWLEKERKE